MNETLTVLNSINEKLGLLVNALILEKPHYVEVAKKALEIQNALVEGTLPVVQENEEEAQPASTEETQTNEIVVGSRVTYTGENRPAIEGMVGTVVDLRKAWTVVRFDESGIDTKCRKKDLSLANNEQPPEKTEVEVAEEATESAQEDDAVALAMIVLGDSHGNPIFDEEAAGFKFSEGSYKQYRDIHAIYTDPKKTEGNRRYLRFRAQNVVKGDEVAKEMCARYLIGVADEVYLKEAGQ